MGYTRVSLGREQRIDFESGVGTDGNKIKKDQMEKEMEENSGRYD